MEWNGCTSRYDSRGIVDYYVNKENASQGTSYRRLTTQ